MWTKDKELGAGSYGTVHLAVDDNSLFLSSSATIAVKTAKLEKAESLQREAMILKKLQGNPFIIQCYGEDVSLAEDGQVEYNLPMEFAAQGDLKALILGYQGFAMPESEVSFYAYMLLRGLSHIHSEGIIHCDIKPDNILVFPSQQGFYRHLKIADFGLAKYAQENIHWFRGTPYYEAPESLLWGLQGTAADIFSLGCVVLEMLNGGRQLWKQENQFEPDIPKDVSESAKDFLRRCFEFVDSRWTADMLLDHPFIRSGINTMVLRQPPGFEHRINSMEHKNNNPFSGSSADQWSVTCGRFSSISAAAATRAAQECSTYQLFPENQGGFSLFAAATRAAQECSTYQLFSENQGGFSLFAAATRAAQECSIYQLFPENQGGFSLFA